MAIWAPETALAAYHAGVTVICELAARFPEEMWSAPTPCPEWRAADLAGHLRCVADDYHEYLDDAPASRMSRLLATGADAGSLARKLARQNAAELAALPDGSGPEHIRAFAVSARAYARRVLPLWQLPHHRYRGTVVTVGGMLGAACAEWHLHAWDLARTLGKDYRPADPDLLVTGWQAGLPQLPLDRDAGRAVAEPAAVGHPAALTPCTMLTAAPGLGHGNVIVGAGGPATVSAGDSPGWHALLRASGRLAGEWLPA
jgi:hypothetical protein